MAERRMFAKTIVLSDAFLDLPMSARCLYFTLGMFADDDGFVNSPRGIMRQCGCSEDDMKILLAKKFLIVFDSGVIVIKHWRINNYLGNDRYTETKYVDEKRVLAVDEKGAYTLAKPSGIPGGIPSLGTPSIGKDRLGKDSTPKGVCGRFAPPTLDEVKAYVQEKNLNVSAEDFYTYFTTPNDKGETWIDSRGSKVKNWKQKLQTWSRMSGPTSPRARSRNTLLNYQETGTSHPNLDDIGFDMEEL